MKKFGYATIILCALIVGILLRGWVLCVLWGWFVVPFFNLPPLTMPMAIGLSFFSLYFFNTGDIEDENMIKRFNNEQTDLNKIILLSTYFISKPIIYLIGGWVITLFM